MKKFCVLLIMVAIGVYELTAQIKVQVQGGSVTHAQKATASSSQESKKLANQDVIDLVSLKVSDDIIINTIRTAEVTEFDTTAAGLKVLKAKNVSDAVIRVMMNPRAAVDAASTAESAKAATSETKPAEVSIAHSQSLPIKFRGAYIGQPLSDYVDCSSGKAKSLKDGYKPHGKLCEREFGVVSRLKMHSRVLSGNGSAEEGESFLFQDGKITRITIFVPDESEWEKVKYDLTQKLGPPSSEVPQIYQNGFGARWEYDQGFWVHENTVAYAGVKVSNFGHQLFSNAPMTEGIQLTITDAARAKLPSKTPSTLD
jgi:hypothetical protein